MRNFLTLIFALALVGVLACPQPVRAQAEPFIGQLMLVAYTFCPRSWAEADGQLLPINQNQALFALLGTTYGGNGQTTFALPDLRGRTPIHNGQGPGLSPYVQGQIGGVESFTLNTQQLPAHNHPFIASSSIADKLFPPGNLLASKDRITSFTSPGSNQAQMADAAIGNTGGNQPVQFRSPYLVMKWCIALQGIFPSRN